MSVRPAVAPDAAMVLGIASTAMPFARTPDEEAERWLRVLRLHGEVGVALQALGVSEMSLVSAEHAAAPAQATQAPHDAVANIVERAVALAVARGSSGVATTDVLLAVMQVYGADFDRVLRAHGTDRDEVLERLGASMPAPDRGELD
jgi:hypothetical protein